MLAHIIKQFTATRTYVVQIKVAEVKLRIEDQLSGTDEVERFAGHTDNVALTVVSVSVRTVNANLTHVLCHKNELVFWNTLYNYHNSVYAVKELLCVKFGLVSLPLFDVI